MIILNRKRLQTGLGSLFFSFIYLIDIKALYNDLRGLYEEGLDPSCAYARTSQAHSQPNYCFSTI